MSNIPNDLKYSKSHEWIRMESDELVTIGITDHAQDLLGDLVFVELPEIGNSVQAGDETGVVESVKAASDVYAPIAGEIVEVNDSLNGSPELVNQSPYQDGWLFRMKPSKPDEITALLDHDAYQEFVDSEEH